MWPRASRIARDGKAPPCAGKQAFLWVGMSSFTITVLQCHQIWRQWRELKTEFHNQNMPTPSRIIHKYIFAHMYVYVYLVPSEVRRQHRVPWN